MELSHVQFCHAIRIGPLGIHGDLRAGECGDGSRVHMWLIELSFVEIRIEGPTSLRLMVPFSNVAAFERD